jgi:PAS domain S-box-containing protein
LSLKPNLSQRQPARPPNPVQGRWAARPREVLIWLPIALGLVIALISVALAQQIRVSEQSAINEATEGALRRVEGEFGLQMESNVRALERLAERWNRQGQFDEPDFVASSLALIRDFRNILVISWVDPDLSVQWIAPLEGSESILGTNLGDRPDVRMWYEAIRTSRRAMLAQGRLIKGDVGFIVSVPLYPKGEFSGFVSAVHRTSDTAEMIFGHIAPGYRIELWSSLAEPGAKEKLVWSRTPGLTIRERTQEASLEVRGQSWRFVVSPGPALVAVHATWMPFVVLIGGCCVAFLLPWSIYNGLLSRRRANSLLWANEDLLDEVRRRARAEAAELLAHEELQSVIDSLPVYVWSASLGKDGSFESRYQSQAVEQITGLSTQYLEGRRDRWAEAVVPEDRTKAEASIAALMSGRVDHVSTEYRIARPDGEIRYVRDRIRKVKTEGGDRFDGLLIDYTEQQEAVDERLRLEARFQHTQKLESLGVLAGGIAHDFNNLLVAILGHARLGRDELPPDSPVRKSIGRIETAAQRAADLCKQMLAYAGMGSFVIEPTDLKVVVEEMHELLRASIPATITLRTLPTVALPAVEADASQLRQVVLNLITNAAESIGDRPGHIELQIETQEYDRESLDRAQFGDQLAPGRYVTLRVTDDGEGMDEETRRRLFEPFFTTKFKGRGLGLAAVLGIVRSHRGALLIESESGQGAAISIILPALDGPIILDESIVDEVEPWRGSGTVLLVEDDEAAREVGNLILTRAGFKVLEARDGMEAIDLFSLYANEVRCVVLDLTMPRMDGEEAQRKLREIRPDVPVILCSGYPEHDAVLRFAGLGLAGFLQKPYLPQHMIERVRVAIGSEA